MHPYSNLPNALRLLQSTVETKIRLPQPSSLTDHSCHIVSKGCCVSVRGRRKQVAAPDLGRRTALKGGWCWAPGTNHTGLRREDALPARLQTGQWPLVPTGLSDHGGQIKGPAGSKAGGWRLEPGHRPSLGANVQGVSRLTLGQEAGRWGTQGSS